uniref:Uncharacterized protein n=1 Tax=Ralstonia solanacearum TaxID=305 RepID=A0A0S4UAL3_RALSL|nr:protein of unknown function [Ralstonia solanacearum]
MVWRLRLDTASEGPTLISDTALHPPTITPLDAFVAHANREPCEPRFAPCR